MRAVVALLLVASSLFAKEPAKADCKSFRFDVSLSAGHDFEKPIGEGLTLTIQHEEGGTGWDIALTKKDRDYIYPANLPIRFNPLQIIGPGYGQTLHDQTSNRTMKFLWKDAEYERITRLEQDVLWPYQTKDPDKAIDDYTHAITRASIGELRLVVRDFKAEKDQLVAIDYDAEIVVPQAFHALTQTDTAACPVQQI
jgi:hypothetical protein